MCKDKRDPARDILRCATDVGVAMFVNNLAKTIAPKYGLIGKSLYFIGSTGIAFWVMAEADHRVGRFYDKLRDVIVESTKNYNAHNETETHTNETEVMENDDETDNQGETSI